MRYLIKMFKTENCEIIDELECDILFQVDYTRKCDECGYKDPKERHFKNVLKCGSTMDQDNWHCPDCGRLCLTRITYEKSSSNNNQETT